MNLISLRSATYKSITLINHLIYEQFAVKDLEEILREFYWDDGFLRLSVNFYTLQLTKLLKIKFKHLEELTINFHSLKVVRVMYQG